MPATQKQQRAASEAPATAPERRLARPRAVAGGVREAADRLVHLPHEIAHAQYELTRHAIESAVVVNVDVNVDVDVASRQVPPGA